MTKIYVAPIGRILERLVKGIQTYKPDVIQFLCYSGGIWKPLQERILGEIKSRLNEFEFRDDIYIDLDNTPKVLKTIALILEKEKVKMKDNIAIIDVTGLPRHVAIEVASFAGSQYYNVRVVSTPSARTPEDYEDALDNIIEDPGLAPQEPTIYKFGIRKLLQEDKENANYCNILRTLHDLRKTGEIELEQNELLNELEQRGIGIEGRTRPAKLRKLSRLIGFPEEIKPCLANLGCVDVYYDRGAKKVKLGPCGVKVVETYLL